MQWTSPSLVFIRAIDDVFFIIVLNLCSFLLYQMEIRLWSLLELFATDLICVQWACIVGILNTRLVCIHP